MDSVRIGFSLGFLAGFLTLVAGNELCNPAVYRCPGKQIAFKYDKKSDCASTKDGLLYCDGNPSSCICLNVEKVCLKAIKYCEISNGDSWSASYMEATTTTTGASTTASTASTASTTTTTAAPTTGATSSSSAANSTVAPTQPQINDPNCRLPMIPYYSECYLHKDCDAPPAGIALCCEGKCLEVHNVPCVRNFFSKADQLCTDVEYKRLFADELVANQDE